MRRTLLLLVLVMSCDRGLTRVSRPTVIDDAPPPGQPVILFDHPAVSLGRSGYVARVETQWDDETYEWSILNGHILAGGDTGTVTFEPIAVGTVLLTVDAANIAGPAVRSATIALPVLQPPTEAPQIDAPTTVTEHRENAELFVVSPRADLTYAWTLERDGVLTPIAGTGPTIELDVGSVGTATVHVRARNLAGDESLTDGTATFSIEPRGLSLLAGKLGGVGNANGTGADARFVFGDVSTETIAATHMADGSLIVVDVGTQTLRRVAADGSTTTVPTPPLAIPVAVTRVPGTSTLVVLERPDSNACVMKKLTEQGDGTYTATVLHSGLCDCDDDDSDGFIDFGSPTSLTADASGNVYVGDYYGIFRVDGAGVMSRWSGTCSSAGGSTDDSDPLFRTFSDLRTLTTLGDTVYALDGSDTIRVLPQNDLSYSIPIDGADFGTFSSELQSTLAVTSTGDFIVAYASVIGLVAGTGPAAPRLLAGVPDDVNSIDSAPGVPARLWAPRVISLADDDTLDVLEISGAAGYIPHAVVRRAKGLSAPSGATVTTLAGRAPVIHEFTDDVTPLATAHVRAPNDLIRLPDDTLLMGDDIDGSYILVTQDATTRTRVAGFLGSSTMPYLSGSGFDVSLDDVEDMVAAPDGTVYFATDDSIRRWLPTGFVTMVVNYLTAEPSFSAPWGIARLSDGTLLFTTPDSSAIGAVFDDKEAAWVAGGGHGYRDGRLGASLFHRPRSMVADERDFVYVVDAGNHRIRRIDFLRGQVTTIAGNDVFLPNDNRGVACLAAHFADPRDIVRDHDGTLYVSDLQAIHRIRFRPGQTPDCIVDTLTAPLSGSGVLLGKTPRFNVARGIAITRSRDLIVADYAENSVFLFRW